MTPLTPNDDALFAVPRVAAEQHADGSIWLRSTTPRETPEQQ